MHTTHQRHFDSERTSRLIELWFAAEIDPADEHELQEIARDYVSRNGSPADLTFDADLRLVASMCRLADTPEITFPEGLSSRLDKAVADAASRSRRALFRRRIMIGAAASVALLLASAIGLDLTYDSQPQPILAKAEKTVTETMESHPANVRERRSGNTISRQTAPSTPTRRQKTNVSARNTQYTDTPVAGDAAVISGSVETSASDPVFLPASATLPAERDDDSVLLASLSIGRSTSNIDEIYSDSEQSMARVALLLEDIFDSAGFE